ncbi:MAG: hypothetical protein LAP87_28650 [Acidobacteriia bacterium]|nr:hypothetical protein [Terriglobia bacterium]
MADRSAYENQILKDALNRTPQCLPLEVLARIAGQGADNAGGAGAQAHLAQCARCRNELQLMQEFETAEPRPDEVASVAWIASQLQQRSAEFTTALPPAAVAKPLWQRLGNRIGQALPTTARWRAVSMACASLALVVTAGVYLRHGAPDEGLSRPNGAIVWRSQQFAVVAPAGDVAAPPAEFQWQPAAGAAKYQVRLLEVDHHEIWSGESSTTSIAVPGGIRSQMAPGRSFLWEVTARNAAGEKIAGTNLQVFHMSVNNR